MLSSRPIKRKTKAVRQLGLTKFSVGSQQQHIFIPVLFVYYFITALNTLHQGKKHLQIQKTGSLSYNSVCRFVMEDSDKRFLRALRGVKYIYFLFQRITSRTQVLYDRIRRIFMLLQ